MRKGPARTYIKRGVWHLGGHSKNQKCRFLPILGAIANHYYYQVLWELVDTHQQKLEKNFGW